MLLAQEIEKEKADKEKEKAEAEAQTDGGGENKDERGASRMVGGGDGKVDGLVVADGLGEVVNDASEPNDPKADPPPTTESRENEGDVKMES